MKKLSIVIFCFSSLTCYSQELTTEFDGKNWQAPYHLSTPAGRDIERFLIPVDFAPQLPYKGVEDIRFMKGWGNVTSNEYWTYAFLWYLDSSYVIDEKIIEINLTSYYTGLVNRNIKPRKIPASKVIPVRTLVKQIPTDKPDAKTFRASITMLDYMAQKPITLNCIIHVKEYKEKNKTFIFYELSPKPFSDRVWLALNGLWQDFTYK